MQRNLLLFYSIKKEVNTETPCKKSIEPSPLRPKINKIQQSFNIPVSNFESFLKEFGVENIEHNTENDYSDVEEYIVSPLNSPKFK